MDTCAKRKRYHEYYQNEKQVANGNMYCYTKTTWVEYEDEGSCRNASYKWDHQSAVYDSEISSRGSLPESGSSCDGPEESGKSCVKRSGSKWDLYRGCRCVKAADDACSGTYKSFDTVPGKTEL